MQDDIFFSMYIATNKACYGLCGIGDAIFLKIFWSVADCWLLLKNCNPF